MKFLLLTLIMWVQISLGFSGGSSGAGNGGDYVRMKFIAIGHNIIDYYQNGFKDIKSVLEKPEDLRQYLDINIIQNSEKQLYDNLNNPVDAIGEPGRIILYTGNKDESNGWTGLLAKNDMVDKLVLHEMLRAHGINDDNYVYSSKVLRRADILSGEAYKMKWALKTSRFIKSHMRNTFTAMSAKNEIKMYQEMIIEIKASNNLKDSSLLLMPIKFLEIIINKQSLSEIDSLQLHRSQIMATNNLIKTVDAISYQRTTTKSLSCDPLLIKYGKVVISNMINLAHLDLLEKNKIDLLKALVDFFQNNQGVMCVRQRVNTLIKQILKDTSFDKQDLIQIKNVLTSIRQKTL